MKDILRKGLSKLGRLSDLPELGQRLFQDSKRPGAGGARSGAGSGGFRPCAVAPRPI